MKKKRKNIKLRRNQINLVSPQIAQLLSVVHHRIDSSKRVTILYYTPNQTLAPPNLHPPDLHTVRPHDPTPLPHSTSPPTPLPPWDLSLCATPNLPLPSVPYPPGDGWSSERGSDGISARSSTLWAAMGPGARRQRLHAVVYNTGAATHEEFGTQGNKLTWREPAAKEKCCLGGWDILMAHWQF
jgi:hypothetical protein